MFWVVFGWGGWRLRGGVVAKEAEVDSFCMFLLLSWGADGAKARCGVERRGIGFQ